MVTRAQVAPGGSAELVSSRRKLLLEEVLEGPSLLLREHQRCLSLLQGFGCVHSFLRVLVVSGSWLRLGVAPGVCPGLGWTLGLLFPAPHPQLSAALLPGPGQRSSSFTFSPPSALAEEDPLVDRLSPWCVRSRLGAAGQGPHRLPAFPAAPGRGAHPSGSSKSQS